MSPHFRSDHDAVTMGSLIIVLIVFTVYCSEVYCDALPTKVVKPVDTLLLKKNNSHVIIEKENFWRNLNLSRRKPKMEESRNLDSTDNEVDKRRGRFLSSLAFLTGLSFDGLATAASSTVKNIAKMPQAFSINLSSSKTSPYFAAYYSRYPLLPYPFFYPFGLAPIDAAKLQTLQNDLTTPQVINLFDNRPIDLAGNNEDYTDEKSNADNGADDRIRLRAEANRNAEAKAMIRGCKEDQNSKETAKEYLQVNAVDLRAALNFQAENQTGSDNVTSSPDNTTHHHHYHHHHHHGYGHKEYPHFPGYYGGYPQNIYPVDLTTQPYSQVSYNVPYEQPANFYHDDKYNVYPGLNPPFSPPFSPDQTNEYGGTDFNRFYPSGYQPLNISDGFKPLK